MAPAAGGPQVRTRDRACLDDTMREMEAAEWASLSDAELLERRISIARIAAGGHDA